MTAGVGSYLPSHHTWVIDYRVYEFLDELLRLAEQNEAVITDIVDAMTKAHAPEYDYEVGCKSC